LLIVRRSNTIGQNLTQKEAEKKLKYGT